MRGVGVERFFEILYFPDRLLVAAAVREDRVEAPPQRFVEDAMVRNPGLRQRQFQPDRILDPLQGRRVEAAAPHEFLAKLTQAPRSRMGAQSQDSKTVA